MNEDDRLDVLMQMPTRLVRKLGMKHGLDAGGRFSSSIARLRFQLSEIEGVLDDEEVDEWS